MNHLPQSTIRLLTSTQAVSGVSSIVKELIENSLDAASSYIEIKLVRYLIMFYICHLQISEGFFNSEEWFMISEVDCLHVIHSARSESVSIGPCCFCILFQSLPSGATLMCFYILIFCHRMHHKCVISIGLFHKYLCRKTMASIELKSRTMDLVYQSAIFHIWQRIITHRKSLPMQTSPVWTHLASEGKHWVWWCVYACRCCVEIAEGYGFTPVGVYLFTTGYLRVRCALTSTNREQVDAAIVTLP